jgi:hypothetical protein
VTVAVWKNDEALEKAGVEVRELPDDRFRSPNGDRSLGRQRGARKLPRASRRERGAREAAMTEPLTLAAAMLATIGDRVLIRKAVNIAC